MKKKIFPKYPKEFLKWLRSCEKIRKGGSDYYVLGAELLTKDETHRQWVLWFSGIT